MRDINIFEKMIGPLTVGKLLKAYRTANALTAAEVDRRLRLSKGTISKLESGKKKFSLKETVKLARKLEEAEELYALAWLKAEAMEAGIDPERIFRSPGET